jgi:hypothetical protein
MSNQTQTPTAATAAKAPKANNATPRASYDAAKVATLWGKVEAAKLSLDKSNVTAYVRHTNVAKAMHELHAHFKATAGLDAFKVFVIAKGWGASTAALYTKVAKLMSGRKASETAAEFVEAVNQGKYQLNLNEYARFLKGAESKKLDKAEALLKVEIDANGKVKISGSLADKVNPETLEAALNGILKAAQK